MSVFHDVHAVTAAASVCDDFLYHHNVLTHHFLFYHYQRFDLGRVDHADGMTFFREKDCNGFPLNSGRLQLGDHLFKAFRRVGNNFAPEFPVREQQGDVQPSLCNVDSEDAI
ncbi:MAG: hypothetical protein ACTFAK_02915 [Candidatus Electronema sp. VV]